LPLVLTGPGRLAKAVRQALTILKPPPELTISDCADANRRLSSEASAEPGQWRTSRAEYQRGIMDAISDGAVESVLIMSSAQVGKALAIDTPIATPAGWTTMRELRPGDIVFDETGAPCRITFAADIMVGHPCYRVVFSDGTSVIADADHLWAVHSDTMIRTAAADGPTSLPFGDPVDARDRGDGATWEEPEPLRDPGRRCA
jgi:hypothetical protein